MKKIPVLLAAFVFATTVASAQTKKLPITPTLSATITHTPGAATIDVLIPGVETITLDLTQPGDATFLIKTADYNADGYHDFAFTSREGTLIRYDLFLYHPEEKTFEALELSGDGICESLSNVRTSAADKTLRVSCPGGNPGKTSTDIYRWETPYSLALVKSTDNSTDALAEKAEGKADAKAEKDEARKDARNARKAAREESEEEE